MEKSIEQIATRENLIIIMLEVKRRMGAISEILQKYGVYFSNKNLSEMVGKVMEKTASEYFTKKMGYHVKNALTDKEPDLFFTDIQLPLEIKVTSTTTAWTGGEFSKRPFNYLMVSWGGQFNEFFVCAVKLNKKDWKSNMSNNYYGPSLSIKKLGSLKDKIILVGNIDEKGRMVREKL